MFPIQPHRFWILLGIIYALFCASVCFGQTDIYVFVGQSNMVGVAACAGLPAAQNPGQLLMYNEYGQLIQAREPDSVYYPNAGTSPSFYAADRLATYCSGHTVVIINCAVSGSYLSQWAPDWSVESYYGRTMACIRNAQSKCSGGRVKGVFWYQGEAETMNPDNVHAYGPATRNLLNAFHTDLCCPVVFVQLGPNPNQAAYPYWGDIQEIQQWIAAGAPSWVSMVSAKNLQAIPGNPYHLDASSSVKLGWMLGDAMYQLQK